MLNGKIYSLDIWNCPKCPNVESGLSLKFKNVVKKLNSSAETNAYQLGPSFLSLASKTITEVE